MDVLFGFVGDGFALVVSDTSRVQSVVVQRTEVDKILQLDSHKMMATSGEPGDAANFSELIKANLQLYLFRNGMSLTTHGAANYTRSELAKALRKGPYQTNLLIAGWDEGAGPSLYFMDYMAALHKMNCASHGYGGYFVLSLLDREWRPNMSLEDAVTLADKGIAEIRSRLVVAPPNFVIKVVDKDGARVLAHRRSTEVVNTS